MFDFFDNSYSLIIAIFASVFGISFPLIFQSIQNIDKKYNSSVLTQEFEKDFRYKIFKILLFIFAVLLCFSPLLFETIKDEDNLFLFHCGMLVSILICIYLFFYVFHRISIFNNANKLLHLTALSKNKNRYKILYDIARFSSQTKNKETFDESILLIRNMLYERQFKTNKNSTVEYSKEEYGLLDNIASNLADFDNSYINNIDFTSILYPLYSKTLISDKTFELSWKMMNNAVYSNKVKWIERHWETIFQYIHLEEFDSKERNANKIKCIKYHIMFGALLIYYKRYESLRFILYYTTSEPAKFPLLLNTYTEIIEFALYISQAERMPLQLEGTYPILNLNNGVNTDKNIADLTFKYLALLFIRLWSFQNPLICFDNPLSSPQTDPEKIDTNENRIKQVNKLIRAVEEWYSDINSLKQILDFIPEKEDVLKKLKEYIVNLSSKNAEIEKSYHLDEKKTDNINNEFIYYNYAYGLSLPSEKDYTRDSNEINVENKEIEYSESVEKKFIDTCYLAELGGKGESLAHHLQNRIANEYIKYIYQNFNLEQIDIGSMDINNYLSSLNLSEKQFIIHTLPIQQLNTPAKQIRIGVSSYPPRLFIIDEDYILTCDAVKEEIEKDSFTEIDELNHLYIHFEPKKEESKYDIAVKQTIKLTFPKNSPKATLVYVPQFSSSFMSY